MSSKIENPAKHFIFLIEYLAVRLVGGLVNLLPLSLALHLARPAGRLLFVLLKKQRERALDNLREAFGKEKSEIEIRKIARESFIYLAEFAVEWLRMPHFAKSPKRYLGIRHVERIHSTVKTEQHGALLLVSHAGHWEIMALIGGLLIARPIGRTIHALARPMKNPCLYNYILRLRGLTGLESIQKMGSVRSTFRALNKNEIVCLLIDQRVEEGSREVNFFGRPALTTSLPALAALRFKTPVFSVSLERTADLRYVLNVEGPLPVQRTDDSTEDIRVNTQRFNDHLEAEIRRNPGHWLWMHNRWRPSGGAK